MDKGGAFVNPLPAGSVEAAMTDERAAKEAERQQRLAAALRANLRRRKDRARAEAAADDRVDGGPDGA
ncbi:MAG: hypothetical protein PGN09_10770 [Sphingomonas fennica]